MIVPKINLGERLYQLAAAKNKVNGRSSLRKQLDPTVDLPSVIQACSLQGRFAIQFSPQALSASTHLYQPEPALIPEFPT